MRGEALLEALGELVDTGRSSRDGLRRHAVLRAAEHRRALGAPGLGAAERGRRLRLLGRADEARRVLESAPCEARVRAWLWELSLCRRRPGSASFAGIDAAVRAEPRRALWRLWRGVGRLREADPRAALADLERAAALDPAWGLPHAAAALAFRAAGDADGELRSLDRALALDPSMAWAFKLRSWARSARGDGVGWLADCEAALRLDENLGHFALRARGTEPVRGGETALRAAAERVLAKEPGAHWALVLRAASLRAPGEDRYLGALADLEAAVRAAPGRAWAWAHLGRARLKEGASRAGMAALERAVRLDPSCGWIRAWRAEALRRRGRAAEALRELDFALAADPDYEFSYAWRGGARRAMGDLEGALADLTLAAALAPEYAWSWQERSLAARAAGRWDLALADLERAHRRDSKFSWGPASGLEALEALARDPRREARARAWLAQARLAEGDASSALREADVALAAGARLPWCRAWRGRALALLGRGREARRELDRAVRLAPRYAPAWAWRGELRRSGGDPRGAREDLTRAAALEPTAAWILAMRGDAEDMRRARELDPGARGEGDSFFPGLDGALARLEPRRREVLERALRDLAGGRTAGALAALRRAAAGRPRCATAAGSLALALELSGEEGSARAIERAARLAPGEAWPLALSGVVALRHGELERARRAFDAAILRRDDPRLRELRAGVLSDLGYVPAAIGDLDAAARALGDTAARRARRARFHLARRDYPAAERDLSAAVAKEPANPEWLRQRADFLLIVNRLPEARADVEAALRLAPREGALAAARVRLLLLENRLGQAEAAIRAVGSRAEALYWRGLIGLKRRRHARAARDLALAAERAKEAPLRMRALFYRAVAKTADPALMRRLAMTKTRPEGARLALCGLGIFPPYTASIEVLHALGRCDVLFNNLPGNEARELLAEFCGDVRPTTYQAVEDEFYWADRIFEEIGKGKSVGFVTRGHPLVFGRLACELVSRARAAKIPLDTYGAVSSIDHLLAQLGLGLGDHIEGVQMLDFPALRRAPCMNLGLPLLASFYQGVEKGGVGEVAKALGRFYSSSHPVKVFGPKYDSPPVELTVGELPRRMATIDPSVYLYLPPASAARAR